MKVLVLFSCVCAEIHFIMLVAASLPRYPSEVLKLIITVEHLFMTAPRATWFLWEVCIACWLSGAQYWLAVVMALVLLPAPSKPLFNWLKHGVLKSSGEIWGFVVCIIWQSSQLRYSSSLSSNWFSVHKRVFLFPFSLLCFWFIVVPLCVP